MAVACTLLYVSGCSCRPPRDTAIAVTVNIASGVRAKCVRIAAISDAGVEKVTAPIDRAGKSRLVIALFRGSDLSDQVTITARGYVGQGCTGTDIMKANEESASVGPVAFVKGAVVPANVELTAAVPHDGDGDGYRAAGQGGPDCDDTSNAVNPEAAEICSDGVDNDCDGGADCADGTCLHVQCATGYCLGDGACGTPSSELNCQDSVDDDQDGQKDCADTLDCNTKPCSSGNQCQVGQTCSGGICGGGTPVTCTTPPLECHQPSGTCQPASGCQYNPTPNVACSGGTCTDGGSCVPAFGYTPSNFDWTAIGGVIPSVSLGCGVSIFSVTGSDQNATFSFTNWCSQPQPTPRFIQLSDSRWAVVLPIKNFSLASSGTLRLQGGNPSLPVILAVFGDATIDGHLDASAQGVASGPGYPFGTRCPRGSGNGNGLTGARGGPPQGDRNGGGGGGGGFASAGGEGSNGAENEGMGGSAGSAANDPDLVPLMGGCRGGHGEVDIPAGSDNLGGGGGGALQLSVAGTLTIHGKVSANGGGGQGGGTNNNTKRSGGGGGGSGGGILLEADAINLSASSAVTASGGGGGEGTDVESLLGLGGFGRGQSGQAGANNAPGAGLGGSSPSIGGNGGNGSGDLNAAGATAGSAALSGGERGGGGGGGGGAGTIRLNARTSCTRSPGHIIFPAATSNGVGAGCP